MRKRTPLLKWGAMVIVLLAVAIFAVGGSPYAAKAATMQENPPPFQTCELTYEKGGGGNIPLVLTDVTDQGLKETLRGYGTNAGYNLLCTDVSASSCELVPDSVRPLGGPPLDLSNIHNIQSKWIYDKLNGQYQLVCAAA